MLAEKKWLAVKKYHPVSQGVCQHCSSDLEQLFHETFYEGYNTRLIGGFSEPYYEPATSSDGTNRLYYREDYFSSALHETAHWCIAGEQRRKLKDFGYWYLPDGRDQSQQQAFEQVEVKPQALEWMFSVASGWKFRLSADNLSGSGQLSEGFSVAVQQQVWSWCKGGLPQRALRFIRALETFYQRPNTLDHHHFLLPPG